MTSLSIPVQLPALYEKLCATLAPVQIASSQSGSARLSLLGAFADAAYAAGTHDEGPMLRCPHWKLAAKPRLPSPAMTFERAERNNRFRVHLFQNAHQDALVIGMACDEGHIQVVPQTFCFAEPFAHEGYILSVERVRLSRAWVYKLQLTDPLGQPVEAAPSLFGNLEIRGLTDEHRSVVEAFYRVLRNDIRAILDRADLLKPITFDPVKAHSGRTHDYIWFASRILPVSFEQEVPEYERPYLGMLEAAAGLTRDAGHILPSLKNICVNGGAIRPDGSIVPLYCPVHKDDTPPQIEARRHITALVQAWCEAKVSEDPEVLRFILAPKPLLDQRRARLRQNDLSHRSAHEIVTNTMIFHAPMQGILTYQKA